jgi:hypothetical protein
MQPHVADIPHYISRRHKLLRDDAIIQGITTFDDVSVNFWTPSSPTRPHLCSQTSLGTFSGWSPHHASNARPLPIPVQKQISPSRPTRKLVLKEPAEAIFIKWFWGGEAKTEIEAPERYFSPPWIDNEAEEMFVQSFKTVTCGTWGSWRIRSKEPFRFFR